LPKYNNINNIPAKVFFEILKDKNYQLLKPKPSEKDLEQVFISIYDDFFIQSENPEAIRYLELTKNVAFLEYKIAMIKSTLGFLYYSTTTRQMRIDYLNALKEGAGIEINVDVDFSDEVKRILTENIGWIENDLNFDKLDLKQMLSKSKGKEMNYIQRLVDLAVASPQNLMIKQDMTLLEFVHTEKAILKYNSELQQRNKK
jgi:hypothetical protein